MIDHINKIEASEDTAFNELVTLRSLKSGLFLLYSTVNGIEEKRRREDKESNHEVHICFGRDPKTPEFFFHASNSIFSWYTISLINYVRLTGFIDGLNRKVYSRPDLENKSGKNAVKAHCDAYVKSVKEIENVLIWRNKVAAHHAITDPRNDDNSATLDASAMYQIGYENGRYKTAIFGYATTDASGTLNKSILPSWSLTEIHESLANRYWRSEIPTPQQQGIQHT